MGFRPCAQGDLFSGIINTTRIQDKIDKELRYEPRDIQIASPQPTFLNFFDNFKVRQVVQVNKRRYQPIVENKEAPRTKTVVNTTQLILRYCYLDNEYATIPKSQVNARNAIAFFSYSPLVSFLLISLFSCYYIWLSALLQLPILSHHHFSSPTTAIKKMIAPLFVMTKE